MGPARFEHRAGAPGGSGPKKSDATTECLGRSRGGLSTKSHACVEALGNAVRLLATPGQANDCPQAPALLDRLPAKRVIADTSYDSDKNRAYCAQKGIDVVIPNRPDRLEPAPFDEQQYQDRTKSLSE